MKSHRSRLMSLYPFDSGGVGQSVDALLASSQLPSLPSVAVRVIQLAQQPSPDLDGIVRVIKTDPAICGKVLKTANSALFGLKRRVSSIEEAAPLLGATLVKTIVLSFSLAHHRGPSADLTQHYQRHWRRSLVQAVVAEGVAMQADCGDPAVFFIAGLLQDVGWLAMLAAIRPEDARLLRLDGDAAAWRDAENKYFGVSHVAVGAEICRRWGLDDQLLEAVRLHHESTPSNDRSSNPPALVCACMAAACIVDVLDRAVDRPELEVIPAPLRSGLGLTTADVVEVLRDVPPRVRELSAMFEFNLGSAPSDQEILENAKTLLEQIALEGHLEAAAARRRADLADDKLSQLEQQRQRWKNEANRDPLTGAYNRRFITAALESEMQTCLKAGTSIGVLFADVDHFKQLNDAHGHAVGDEALKQFARILRESTRESDLVVRYGGDEFLVVLTNVTMDELRDISQRICHTINTTRLACDSSVHMTSSVGSVFYTRESLRGLTSHDVIEEVDDAMYRAKQQGKNRFVMRNMAGSETVTASGG